MDILWIKAAHLAGFAGCILASGAKNLLLRAPRIEGAGLARLVVLDKVSGLSALVILASGVAMAGWLGRMPDDAAGLGLLAAKVALFVLASGAVLTTKPVLRRARQAGVLIPDRGLRLRLGFDFGAVLCIALLGLWLVHGLA
ncbi:DUF2214 family protein [Sedimentimonas flavescens]|uniref:DUF2214 family protein n=1 Tax=Sedimentimonas flavescens TaxID=2851012 RepID=UPI0021A6FC17|nr:DUF2214 family protein [Sedimentimonas flavescens]MCT2539022.1 DUF2214 family protein [Sedimentimonas flavescens]